MKFDRLAREQHDTLEGVPEPAENPRLCGHREPAAMLAEAYRAGRLPHGLILAGPSGIGKATLAFHLARHVLQFPAGHAAPGELARTDVASPLFRQVASGAHPAVLHLTRPLNDRGNGFKTVISVDEIRRIGRFLSHTSHDNSYRVVIVDPTDDLNTQAANALLKNLEEPPTRTLFILVTQAFGRLLPTLRSRCQAMKLGALGTRDLIAALDGMAALPEGETAQEQLRQHSGGSVRQAILLLEEGGLEIANALEAFAAASRFGVAEAYRLADAVSARGREASMDIMKTRALDLIAAAAGKAARTGEIRKADRLSAAWSAAKQSSEEAAAFNLDRKQHALELMGRLHAALHG